MKKLTRATWRRSSQQRFLRDLRDDRLLLAFLPDVGQQQQNPRRSLLAE
jgi:hypothetical protein